MLHEVFCSLKNGKTASPGHSYFSSAKLK